LTDPGPHRINPADRLFPIIGEERTRRHAGFGVLDLAALSAIKRVHEKRAEDLRDKHDPLPPLAENIEPYLVPWKQLDTAVRLTEAQLKERFQKVLRRVIWDAKCRQDPNAAAFRQHGRLPILLIGGGSELPFFRSAVEEPDYWLRAHTGNEGMLLLTNEPFPNTLVGDAAKHNRIAVAWGLSHRALDIGEITPADRITDIEPPPRRNCDDGYVGKEQV